MPRPISATIRIAALQRNLAVLHRCTRRADGSGPRLWAVVKAAAYGHGLAAAQVGFARADGLALLDFDDALRLRAAGWTRPILMLEGAFEPADVATAREHGLDLTVHSAPQLAWLEARPGAPVDVHLKLNSGMNRLGFAADRFRAAHDRLAASPGVRSVTLMTHFATADDARGVDWQLERFAAVTDGLPGPRSLANSAASLAHPSTHADWVRPGIALYGATPFADRSAAELGLAAAMSLESRIIAVQALAAGDVVGYGASFVAPGPMRVGIVACGYADGYPRHAPTGTPVMVDGIRTRTLGRVSMDMLAVDLTPLPAAREGSVVELWGERLPIDEVAAAAGTIGYELMCALAPRVPVQVLGATVEVAGSAPN